MPPVAPRSSTSPRAAEVSRQTVSNALNHPDKVAARHPRAGPARDRPPRLHPARHRPAAAPAQGRAPTASRSTPPAHGRMGHILDEFLVRAHRGRPRPRLPPGDLRPGPRATSSRATARPWPPAWSTASSSPTPATATRGPQWLLDHDVPFVAFGRIWDLPELTPVGRRRRPRRRAARGRPPRRRRATTAIGFLGWPDGSPVGDDRRSGWLAGLRRRRPARTRADRRGVASQDLDQATAAADRLLDAARPRQRRRLRLGHARPRRRARGRATAASSPAADIGVVGFDDTDVAEALPAHERPAAARTRRPETAWRPAPGRSDRGAARPVLLTPDPRRSAPTTTRAPSSPASGRHPRHTHTEEQP